jgi:rhamnosyltransferase
VGNENKQRVGIFVPTLNAAGQINRIIATLEESSVPLSNLFVIDSESSDGTTKALQNQHITYQTISRKDFSHGLVRKKAANYFRNKVDFLLMFTQDVIFTKESIDSLIQGIVSKPNVGVSYGKQRSTRQNSAEYYDRYFNYPDKSRVKKKSDIPKLGPSTYFSSDAFSIYRLSAVFDIGNFPEEINFAEDAYMSAKLILTGWDVYYNARAEVIHNNLSGYRDLYLRYRYIAKFYHSQKWIGDHFGTNYGKGKKLVLFELKESWRNMSPRLFFDVIISSAIKFVAYLPSK